MTLHLIEVGKDRKTVDVWSDTMITTNNNAFNYVIKVRAFKHGFVLSRGEVDQTGDTQADHSRYLNDGIGNADYLNSTRDIVITADRLILTRNAQGNIDEYKELTCGYISDYADVLLSGFVIPELSTARNAMLYCQRMAFGVGGPVTRLTLGEDWYKFRLYLPNDELTELTFLKDIKPINGAAKPENLVW